MIERNVQKYFRMSIICDVFKSISGLVGKLETKLPGSTISDSESSWIRHEKCKSLQRLLTLDLSTLKVA